MSNYICRIATVDEIANQFDYWIKINPEQKENWIKWKEQEVNNAKENKMIAYYGFLNDKVISETYARISPEGFNEPEGIVDSNTAYLFAFRTIKEYQNKGYFSRLYDYMINDLKSRGYKKVTLSVDPEEIKNVEIYHKKGFTELIKRSKIKYPDGYTVNVDYYGKEI